jgi:hypothetical protein
MVLPGTVGIDTPRTEVGNATYLTNAELDFSLEQSFQSPGKDNDILTQMKQSRGVLLKTPRGRQPLGDRRNAPGPAGEFTPLLKSVTKANLARNGKPETPAFLRAGHHSVVDSPLPEGSSAVDGENTGSSFGNGHDESTPIPQIHSSSAVSTPMAMLPKRDNAGVLTDQGQMMTLREQENVSKEDSF